ncbi:serine protease [Aneurinibacillus thermoaerophilus]|uniref:serine protease n=1 Tax=Aneurinibacillus thermoaerophilus TaxID=143495 RepID=UPI002E1D4153|nr:serine protease [Aneurinibacillus thermoaerophilus]MED0766277.1 serine protease [Aneurinibacillus thermoaerophilus]
MNYFIIFQDERVFDAVEPVGISRVLRKEMLTEEHIDDIEELHLQFPIKEKTKNEYVDFIQKPIPLLSDKLKQIIEKYAPGLYVKPVVLVDRKRMRQALYWMMIPPCIDCLSERSEFHKDGTIKRLVIDETRAAFTPLFQIEGIMEKYIVINLAVAESLLRRDFTGIRLAKVEKESVREEK